MLGQKVATVAAHQPGNSPNPCHPNPGPRGDAPPCIRYVERSTIVLLLLLQEGHAGGLDLDGGGGRDAAGRRGRPGVGEVAVL